MNTREWDALFARAIAPQHVLASAPAATVDVRVAIAAARDAIARAERAHQERRALGPRIAIARPGDSTTLSDWCALSGLDDRDVVVVESASVPKGQIIMLPPGTPVHPSLLRRPRSIGGWAHQ